MVKSYFELQKAIYDYFEYSEDWVTIPLSNYLDDYWFLTGDKERDGYCVYYNEPLTEDVVRDGATYSNRIYTQRFLSKWVYRTEDFTLVCADTRTDGNKCLMILDNKKECKDEKLVAIYEKYWNRL